MRNWGFCFRCVRAYRDDFKVYIYKKYKWKSLLNKLLDEGRIRMSSLSYIKRSSTSCKRHVLGDTNWTKSNPFLHIQSPALNRMKTAVWFSKQNTESFVTWSGTIALGLPVIFAHCKKILNVQLWRTELTSYKTKPKREHWKREAALLSQSWHREKTSRKCVLLQ